MRTKNTMPNRADNFNTTTTLLFRLKMCSLLLYLGFCGCCGVLETSSHIGQDNTPLDCGIIILIAFKDNSPSRTIFHIILLHNTLKVCSSAECEWYKLVFIVPELCKFGLVPCLVLSRPVRNNSVLWLILLIEDISVSIFNSIRSWFPVLCYHV